MENVKSSSHSIANIVTQFACLFDPYKMEVLKFEQGCYMTMKPNENAVVFLLESALP